VTFEPKKFNEVFEDMRERSSVITDFEVGSVARTTYESFAYEMALLYEKMRLVYLSAYVDTAQGQQLDMVVSVLGIKRGLPDFAEGVVTFERDVGNEDIEIPLGTLVSTEDTPESPKKVYQIIEAKTLFKDHTSVDVKVQAVNRGEEQVTPAETIVVMPRPIPGIKSVINGEDIRFIGKRRETDEELCERAKNALISAGKATIIAIENALLSQPGVKDVKVNENFHFAQGKVVLERTTGTAEITIPKGTVLTANGVQTFETTERVVLEELEEGETPMPVEVTVQSSMEGKAGEVTTAGVAWAIEGNTGLETLTASNPAPILLGDFGIIEVFVDIEEFDQEKQRLQGEIDRVRAAGIFVLLKPTTTVNVDGVFKIQITPDLKLSPEERAEFEETVKNEIETYISELKMGQSLLFSQIIKSTLSLDGIDDLEDFAITTRKEQDSVETSLTFGPSDRRIEIQEFEKFDPRYICVASETKSLPVHVQFKAAGLDASTLADILTALGEYFGGLAIGDEVQRSEIESLINDVSDVTLEADTLVLAPKPWCPRAPTEGADVEVSFAEQAVLGDVFAYHSLLEITGALKLTLPTTMTGEEKASVRNKTQAEIEAYLENLKSEADVVFEDLIAIAAAVDRVLAVDLDWQDFRVELDGAEVPGRVTEDKIEVKPFEKAHLAHVCITGDVETVEIAVTTLAIDWLLSDPSLPDPDKNPVKSAIKQAIKSTVDNFLSDAEPGDDVVYSQLKGAIEDLVPGVDYNVTGLTVTAASECDGREQETDVATKNLHIRSVEIPVMQPISEASITVNEIPPPENEGGGE
jgi:uncharacterized phage protein gp47/JayE